MHLDNPHFELNKLLHSKMNKIYFFQAIFTFIKSLIGIFVPVYLFSIGFSVYKIIFFVMGISLMCLLVNPLGTKIISKIGFKYTILLSIPFYFIQLFALFQVETIPIYFHLIWISYGIHMALFWPAFHSEIVFSGSNQHRSSEVGTLHTLTALFGAFAPFVGGFFLQYIGFNALLLFASILLIIGLIPFFLSQDISISNSNVSYSKYIEFIKTARNNPKKKIEKRAFLSEGLESLLVLVLWPLILFYLFKNNFFKLGTLFTFVSILSVIFIIYYKSKIDLKGKDKFVRKLSKFLSFNWYLRFFGILISVFFIVILEIFFKLLNSIFLLSYISIFYNNTKNQNFMEYILFRDFFIHLAKISFGFLLIGIYFFVGFNYIYFYFVVLLGILAPVGQSFLKEEKLNI